ncbi:MAG: hypothetical protein AAF725_13005, partial [Acidobacteriota bacterium]
MRAFAAERRLRHCALQGGDFKPGEAYPLEEERVRARLTDQQRLGLVMQAAALLCHLEQAKLRLVDGTAERAWRCAEVVPGGLLKVGDGDVREGRPVDSPQRLLLTLLRLLFDTADDISGRGAARRVGRELIGHWRQELARIPPELALVQILDAAPFLWRPSFGPARQALVAEHGLAGASRSWVAGPGA